MFVEASALLAMMLDEEEARILAARLQASATRITSTLAVFETIVGLVRALGLSAGDGGTAVAQFLELMGIKVMSVPGSVVPLAASALSRYGEALTPSECLAYASARYYRLPLLYWSAGFAATDIEPA